MVGDRETDLQFARNLGCAGCALRPRRPATGRRSRTCLAARPRTAEVARDTRETRIRVSVDLDREAEPRASTGIGFFDHMLEQLGKHGGFALALRCEGDVHVDEHHTVEDCALALGQALRAALGDKRGIGRYGFALPMDESLRRGAARPLRPPLVRVRGRVPARARRRAADRTGAALLPLARRQPAARTCTCSVSGENAHHMVEACFKAVARALRQALRREGDALPSTKGVL